MFRFWKRKNNKVEKKKKPEEDKYADEFCNMVSGYVKKFSKIIDDAEDKELTMKVLSAVYGCRDSNHKCKAPYKDSLDCRFCGKKDTISCDRYWDR